MRQDFDQFRELKASTIAPESFINDRSISPSRFPVSTVVPINQPNVQNVSQLSNEQHENVRLLNREVPQMTIRNINVEPIPLPDPHPDNDQNIMELNEEI